MPLFSAFLRNFNDGHRIFEKFFIRDLLSCLLQKLVFAGDAMNTISNMKAGLLAMVIVLGACATPEMAAQDQAGNATQNEQTAATSTKLTLPLDHGPRAEVTPWVNEQRRLRAQQGK